MAATAPSHQHDHAPAPSKLRTVLDYVPCEACLQEPDPDQELLCSLCARLDREVAVKRVTHRKVIVVRPPAPIPVEEEIAPPAPAEDPERGPVEVVPHEAEARIEPPTEAEPEPRPEPEAAPEPEPEPDVEPEPALPLPEVAVAELPAWREPDAVHVLERAKAKSLLGPRGVPKGATLVVVEELPDPLAAPAPLVGAVPSPEDPEPEAAPASGPLAAESPAPVDDEPTHAGVAAEALVHEREEGEAPADAEEEALAYAPAVNEVEPVADPEPEVAEEPEPEPEVADEPEPVAETEHDVALEDAEDEDDADVAFGFSRDDDVGFGVSASDSGDAAAEDAEDEDEDDFDVGFTFRPSDDKDAEKPARSGSLYDETGDAEEESDFTFRPAAPSADVAEDEDEDETTFEPEPAPARASAEDDADRSPWARPMDDDWLEADDEPEAVEAPADAVAPVEEEAWPDEAPEPVPAIADSGEDAVQELELVEDDAEDAAAEPVEEPWPESDPAPDAATVADADDDHVLEMEVVEMEIVEDDPEPAPEDAPDAPTAPDADEEPWPDEDAVRQDAPADAPVAAAGAGDAPAGVTLALTELPGATDADAQRLHDAASVRDARDLLGRDPWQLADLTGLSGKRVEKWIWSAEMALIAGVPVAYVDVLIKSGVKGLDALRNVEPDVAVADVNRVVALELERDLAPITVDDVNAWKRQA